MKNKKLNELAVCGIEAVKALERAHPDAIQRLYFNAARSPHFGGLCKKLAARKVPYNCVKNDSELEKLCGSIHHQGVVAMITQPEIPRLSAETVAGWVQRGESALVLDRVGNANNLGAIVRSAAFFGTVNIVIPLDEAQSSVTTSAYRVAQGGMEFIRIYTVSSLPALLKDVRGQFVCAGTDVRSKNGIENFGDFVRSGASGKNDGQALKPVLLILGNEESGISQEVREQCDFLFAIQGAPFYTDAFGVRHTAVESLNVAQAAAVCLYELHRLLKT